MGRVRLLQTGAPIVDEVAGLLAATGDDFSDAIVVFPGKRPGHFLRKELAAKKGSAYIPPAVFSIDTFVDHICSERLKTEALPIEAIDAVSILLELHAEGKEKLGGGYFDGIDAFYPLGSRLLETMEDLLLAGVTLQRLRDSIAGVSSTEVFILARFYDEFYSRLRREKLTTRGMRYQIASERISEAGFEKVPLIVLAGFFGLSRTEEKIFRYLTALDASVTIFSDGRGISAQMDRLGMTAEEAPPRPEPIRRRYVQCADLHGEAFALSHFLHGAEKRPSEELEKSVVVLPSASALFPVYHFALAPLSPEQYNISLGYPVTRTPVWGFLQTAFDAVGAMQEGKFLAPEYLAFALHPYTKNIRFRNRTEATRILFNTIEDAFRRHRHRILFSLDELESDRETIGRAADRLSGTGDRVTVEELAGHLRMIHDGTLRKLAASRDAGAFALSSMEILRFIEASSTARLHAFFEPFAEEVMNILRTIAVSRCGSMTFEDAGGPTLLLRRAAEEAGVPFAGTPLKGLQVLGFLETRGLRFDRVFFLDLNDDVIPGGERRDPILPLAIRERLGLATYKERDMQSSYWFDQLLAGAKEATLFTVESGRKEPSRFLQKLVWDEEQDRGKLQKSEEIPTVQYALSLATPRPGIIAKSRAMIEHLRVFQYSASSLDAYLACGRRFYFRYLLGLRERDELTADVEASDIGTIVHRILAELYRAKVGKRLTPAFPGFDALDTIAGRILKDEFGERLAGPAHLLQNQIRSHLREFLESFEHPRLGVAETELLGVEVALQFEQFGVTLKGFADRIELSGGKHWIIDYKTGSIGGLAVDFQSLDVDDRKSWNSAIGSLQLPLYRLLYSGVYRVPKSEIIPAFFHLGRNTLDNKLVVPLFAASSGTAEEGAKIDGVIAGLLGEILDEQQPFLPPERLEESCPGCPFQTNCDTRWVQAH